MPVEWEGGCEGDVAAVSQRSDDETSRVSEVLVTVTESEMQIIQMYKLLCCAMISKLITKTA